MDVVWIFIIACLQCSILPSITGNFIYIDLLTSWLTVTLIRQDLLRGALLASLSAFILETHSTLPAGIYFCIYGVALAVITNLKDPLSWTHRMPWGVCIAIFNLWAVLFEVIVLAILNDQLPYFEWSMAFSYVLRLLFAIPFGLFVAARQIKVALL